MAIITHKLARWAIIRCVNWSCSRGDYAFGNSETHNPLKEGDTIPSACRHCGSTVRVELTYTDTPFHGVYVQVYREVPVGLI